MAPIENHETDDERLLHRMLFFTDAVFAIVLTLLALELRPPQTGDAQEALREIGYHLFNFSMTFAVVAIFWVSHMSTMRRLTRFDWPTTVINLVFMAPICVLPFASSLLTNHEGTRSCSQGQKAPLAYGTGPLRLSGEDKSRGSSQDGRFP